MRMPETVGIKHMLDLVYVAVMLGFLWISLLYVRATEKL
jgi:hypothetical protein